MGVGVGVGVGAGVGVGGGVLAWGWVRGCACMFVQVRVCCLIRYLSATKSNTLTAVKSMHSAAEQLCCLQVSDAMSSARWSFSEE